MGIKFPTPWKTLIIKFPPPRHGKGVKCPGYARVGHVEASIWPIHNRNGFDLPQAINLFWPCIFAVVFRHSFLPQTSTLAWKDQTLRVKKVIGKLKQTFGFQWWNVAFGFGFHVWRPSRATEFRFHGKEGSRSHCLSAIPVTNVRQFAPQTIRPRQLVPKYTDN